MDNQTFDIPTSPSDRVDETPVNQRKKRQAKATAFGMALSLEDVLAEAEEHGLDRQDRERIVDQALVLIEQLYVHLPLKRAMFAIDPAQRLKLLRRRLSALTEAQFNREMLSVFTDLRDLHTNYMLPAPYRGLTAILPFLIEEFYENNQRQYMVSHVAEGFRRHAWFKPGVIVTHWNGLPMHRAVELNAEYQMGSNPDARHARGLEAMTIRPLMLTVPPDEEWVTIRYLAKGEPHDIQLRWRVIEPTESPNAADPNLSDVQASYGLGYDALTETARRVKKILFATKSLETEKRMAALSAQAPAAENKTLSRDLKKYSTMPDVFSFRPVETEYGEFGYIRIWTFMVDDAEEFVQEFIRIARMLPQNGLILDVRANGGGLITAGEGLLQVLTPKPIEPSRFHFINTPLTLALCERVRWLDEWVPSIAQAVETGSTYSNGYPLGDAEEYNSIGQQYHGPILLIVDALCYSTTDIFAAGFQDHNVGVILGTNGNMGAGGANVWTHELLRELFPASDSPFRELPHGASFRVAMRRTTRVGAHSGVPVEGLGVLPDEIHRMTANDLLNKNQDLILRATRLLSQRAVRKLEAHTAATENGTLKINVETKNITRLDVWVGNRPHTSLDVSDGETSLSVGLDKKKPVRIELRGYDGDELVAATRIHYPAD